MKVPVNGQELFRLRKEAGLTQQELADQADIGLRTLQAMEAGGSANPRRTIEPVARIFMVPRKQLIVGRDPPDSEDETTRIGVEWDYDYDKLDEKQLLLLVEQRLTMCIVALKHLEAIHARKSNSVIVYVDIDNEAALQLITALAYHQYSFDPFKIHLLPDFKIPAKMIAELFLPNHGDEPLLSCTYKYDDPPEAILAPTDVSTKLTHDVPT